MVNFGQVQTGGGVLVSMGGQSARVVPLPDGQAFEVVLAVSLNTPATSATVREIHAINAKGARTRAVEYTQQKGLVRWMCDPQDYGYRIAW
jgi:hypothetical protein